MPDICNDFFDVFDTLWAREKATTRLFLENRMFLFQNYFCKVSIRAGRDLGNKIQKLQQSQIEKYIMLNKLFAGAPVQPTLLHVSSNPLYFCEEPISYSIN